MDNFRLPAHPLLSMWLSPTHKCRYNDNDMSYICVMLQCFITLLAPNAMLVQHLQCVTIEFRQGSIYIVNSHFSRPPNRHKSCNSTKPFQPIYTMYESFQMRYCITLYLKRYQKYDRSKLKHVHLTKIELSNLTCHIFDTPLGTGYMIGKLFYMVNMSQMVSFLEHS